MAYWNLFLQLRSNFQEILKDTSLQELLLYRLIGSLSSASVARVWRYKNLIITIITIITTVERALLYELFRYLWNVVIISACEVFDDSSAVMICCAVIRINRWTRALFSG